MPVPFRECSLFAQKVNVSFIHFNITCKPCADGVTNFYSPCHAGCLEMIDLDKVDFEFDDDEMPEFDEDGISANKTEEKPKGAHDKQTNCDIYECQF